MSQSSQQLPTIVNRVDSPPGFAAALPVHRGGAPADACSDVGQEILHSISNAAGNLNHHLSNVGHHTNHHLSGASHTTNHHLSGVARGLTSDIGHSSRDVLKGVHEGTHATLGVGMALQKATCDTGAMLQKGICDIEADISDDIKDFALSNFEHQRDILSGVHKLGERGIGVTKHSGEKTRHKVSKEGGRTRKTMKNETFKLAKGQTEILLEGRDTREVVLAKLCDIDRRATKNVGTILLDNARNTCAIKDQIEDCCCDLKQLIVNDGNTTRTLIEENVIDDLQGQIATLTAQLIAAGIVPALARTEFRANRS
jgi:hypothetical protein